MGIVGYGRIGRRVGELAEVFGMRLLAHDPVSAPPANIAAADLTRLASASDIVTLHVPLTNETHHLVDKAFLDHLNPGAILVNCGRGGLLDLDAALVALRSGRLAGVGLDVFDPEPPLHHSLFDHPNVVLTPHLMGLTRRATAATFADAARGVVDVLAGRSPAAVANPDWADPNPSAGSEQPPRLSTKGS
jgi:phosphoglycerate dehydrogenase-like enzyme